MKIAATVLVRIQMGETAMVGNLTQRLPCRLVGNRAHGTRYGRLRCRGATIAESVSPALRMNARFARFDCGAQVLRPRVGSGRVVPKVTWESRHLKRRLSKGPQILLRSPSLLDWACKILSGQGSRAGALRVSRSAGGVDTAQMLPRRVSQLHASSAGRPDEAPLAERAWKPPPSRSRRRALALPRRWFLRDRPQVGAGALAGRTATSTRHVLPCPGVNGG